MAADVVRRGGAVGKGRGTLFGGRGGRVSVGVGVRVGIGVGRHDDGYGYLKLEMS